MMKKYLFISLLVLFISAFFAGCGSKAEPKHREMGISLAESAFDYAMQGQKRMAEYTYNKAIEKFRDMGKYCDMARVAIVMDSVSQNVALNTLPDAQAFAALGECADEKNILNFIEDKNFSEIKLEEPYRSFAEAKRLGSSLPLKTLLLSSGLSDRTRSNVYRMIADMALENDPEATLEYVNKAKKIDEEHAWTSNLLSDERLALLAETKLALPTDITSERIIILEKALAGKY